MGLDVGGSTEKPDWPKLGPSLVIATALIVAIRTARWQLDGVDARNDFRVKDEIDWAARLARRILGELVTHHPGLFSHMKDPWFVPNDEDAPK
jgi:hypothetical protein